jgi:putative transposase
MPCTLCLEFPEAIHNGTSRGYRCEAIYRDGPDSLAQLAVIGPGMDRFDTQVAAYCQIGNHCLLMLHTWQANSSRAKRHIHGAYTQEFNLRNVLVGHLLHGRFKAILIDGDANLLALCRDVERYPVAVRFVSEPGDWAWSSYNGHVGTAPAPDWLDTDGLYAYLLGRAVTGDKDRAAAARKYAALVAKDGAQDNSFWKTGLRQQVFLGDDEFVQRMQAKATQQQRANADFPMAQRRTRPKRTLHHYLQQFEKTADALAQAYRDGAMTMTAMAQALALSVPTVSRWIASSELQASEK